MQRTKNMPKTKYKSVKIYIGSIAITAFIVFLTFLLATFYPEFKETIKEILRAFAEAFK